jgi:hypothetical protein
MTPNTHPANSAYAGPVSPKILSSGRGRLEILTEALAILRAGGR